jgi:hypothetical protein
VAIKQTTPAQNLMHVAQFYKVNDRQYPNFKKCLARIEINLIATIAKTFRFVVVLSYFYQKIDLCDYGYF